MEKKFPEDMRVLVVDDNPTCLTILEAMLVACKYRATTTTQVSKALDILRQEKFHLVITEIDLAHHMEGFELLEQVRLEMDIPVIVLSSHDSKEMIMKGITEGASAYLLKPVRIEVIKNIWQHVIRRNLDIEVYNDHSASKEGMTDRENIVGQPNKKRKDHKEDPIDHDHDIKRQQYQDPIVPTEKKPRVVWTAELHQKFVAAVNHLGLDKAVPKRILEYMNDANITRENVASHLQKYRMHMKKSNGHLQAANMVAAYGQLDINTQFMGCVGGCGQSCIETGYRYSHQPAAAAAAANGTVDSRWNTTTARLAGDTQGGITQWSGQASNLVGMTQMMMNQSQNYLPHGMPMPTPLDQFDNGQQNTTDITHTQMQQYLDASAAHSTDDHYSESDTAFNQVINGAAAIDYDFVNSINDLMLEENLSNNYTVNAQPEVEASVSENNGSSTEADQDSILSDFSAQLSNYDTSSYNGNWTSITGVTHQSTSLCAHPSSDNMPTISSSEFDLQRQQHSLSNHIVGNHMMNYSQIPAAACDREFFSHQYSNNTFSPTYTNSLVVHSADQANNSINMLDRSSGSFHMININGGHGFNFARESDNVQGPPLATQPQDDNYGQVREASPANIIMSEATNKNINVDSMQTSLAGEYT